MTIERPMNNHSTLGLIDYVEHFALHLGYHFWIANIEHRGNRFRDEVVDWKHCQHGGGYRCQIGSRQANHKMILRGRIVSVGQNNFLAVPEGAERIEEIGRKKRINSF